MDFKNTIELTLNASLRELDHSSIVNIRLVSHRFDAIAASIQYRTIHLNNRIISPSAKGEYPRALEHVYAHTRHVVAGSNLDPDGIRRILTRIRRLVSVRWKYTTTSALHQDTLFLPSDILSPTQTSTRLEVEDLPLQDFSTAYTPDTYNRAIPPMLLVSLKMATPIPPLTTKLESLKRLVLASRRLETFHYADRGQGTRFYFSPEERMPPLKDLSMKCYDWDHGPEDVEQHWNFTKLEKLELNLVPLFPFLSSIDYHSFGNLRELRLDDYSAHLVDHRAEATVLLHRLIRDHLRDLRVICITVHTRLFPLDAVAKHAATLVELRLRDHVGFSEDDRGCPTLWAHDLWTLSHFLTNLKKLELDMDTPLCDPSAFLRALCRFRKVDELTLHVQTVIRPLELVYPSIDRDWEVSMRTFGALIRGQEEVNTLDPFLWQPWTACQGFPESMTTPWRSVTLNVGGWKRVMVRRLGDAWRRQNERGVFAERCFVMERSADGELQIREERCVENWNISNTTSGNACITP